MRFLPPAQLALLALTAASCILVVPFDDPQGATSGSGGASSSMAMVSSVSTSSTGSAHGGGGASVTSATASGTGGAASSSGAGGSAGAGGTDTGFVCGSNEIVQWRIGPTPMLRFMASGNDVLDQYTGLLWQNPANAPFSPVDWPTASLACTTPWRLPTQTELFSVFNTADPSAFDNPFWGPPGAYWSSSVQKNTPADNWRVQLDFPASFLPNQVNTSVGASMNGARCVQSTKTPAMGCTRYVVGMTTTLDNVTGITWARTPSQALVLNPAQNVCVSGTPATAEQLLTLLDPTQPDYLPAGAGLSFLDVGHKLWSTTPSGSGFNFQLDFLSGRLLSPTSANGAPVWCVQ